MKLGLKVPSCYSIFNRNVMDHEAFDLDLVCIQSKIHLSAAISRPCGSSPSSRSNRSEIDLGLDACYSESMSKASRSMMSRLEVLQHCTASRWSLRSFCRDNEWLSFTPPSVPPAAVAAPPAAGRRLGIGY